MIPKSFAIEPALPLKARPALLDLRAARPAAETWARTVVLSIL
jgi:hypothetical protein